MSAVTHETIDTKYSADSVEWCPIEDFHDLMLCGTYQLEETKQDDSVEGKGQVRVGRLYLYKLDNQSENPQLHLCTSLDMAGILDIKWSYQLHVVKSRPCFAVVNSVGYLKVFIVNADNEFEMVTETLLDDDCLGLSLEWNNMISPRNEAKIVSSDSKGGMHVHQMCESCIQELVSWKAHEFEAWISAFDQWKTDIVYSGGDDCKLKVWDLRIEPQSPVLTSKKHSMGVCSVQSSPREEYQLATGRLILCSYDEHLLLWDSRSMKQPLREIKLDGGIWRIKWEPDNAKHILTATMYNGFHIIDTSEKDLSVLMHYKEHGSIAYGADWYRNYNKSQRQSIFAPSDYIIGTCSFYDHTLKLWTYQDANKEL